MSLELGTSSYSYLWSHPFDKALEELAGAGFAQVELMACAPHPDRAEGEQAKLERYARCAESLEIQIIGVNPPGLDLNLVSPDVSIRELSVARYLDVVRASALLGAQYLVVVVGRRHPLLPAPLNATVEWLKAAIEKILPAARDAGLEVVLENTPSNFLDTAGELSEFIEDMGSPEGLSICYDVANGFMVENPAEAYERVRGEVSVVHLSDTSSAVWRHDAIGVGEVDFATFLDAMHGAPPQFALLETIHPGDVANGLRRDRARLMETGWAP